MSILLQRCSYPTTQLARFQISFGRMTVFTTVFIKLAPYRTWQPTGKYMGIFFFKHNFDEIYFWFICQEKTKQTDFDQNAHCDCLPQFSLGFSQSPRYVQPVLHLTFLLFILYSVVVTGSLCSPQSFPSRTNSLLL